MIILKRAPYRYQVTDLLSDFVIIKPNETVASFFSGVTITDIYDAK